MKTFHVCRCSDVLRRAPFGGSESNNHQSGNRLTQPHAMPAHVKTFAAYFLDYAQPFEISERDPKESVSRLTGSTINCRRNRPNVRGRTGRSAARTPSTPRPPRETAMHSRSTRRHVRQRRKLSRPGKSSLGAPLAPTRVGAISLRQRTLPSEFTCYGQ